MNKLVPKRMFFTKGVGVHKNKLQSFELALRAAGIEKCNLVSVSSIFPPDCKIISREAGIQELSPGQITFVVMARENTNEPNRLMTAAIGLAQPKDKKQYGYISEHHGFGETQRKGADFAEDLAATMLEDADPKASLQEGLASSVTCFAMNDAMRQKAVVDCMPYWVEVGMAVEKQTAGSV